MNNYGMILMIAEVAMVVITIVLGFYIKKAITQSGYQPDEEKIAEYNERFNKAQRAVINIGTRVKFANQKTMAEKIAELDDLLKKGEITQDEYKDEKNKIIMEG